MRNVLILISAFIHLPAVQAQVTQCKPLRVLPQVRAEGATQREPKRDIPTGGYTLALTWSPEICAKGSGRRDAFRCDPKNGRFGFTLHGLWPDGTGRTWPQYCRVTGVLPPPVIRGNLCVTPDAQLIQHEWAKHGTCMTTRPAAYFDRSRALYARLGFPDMVSLSRKRKVTVGELASSFAAANPGLTSNMMRVTVTRDGWLNEIWLCLNKRFAAERCKTGSGGAPSATPIKIRMPSAITPR